jgi:uracil-DNA glycosylase family protein
MKVVSIASKPSSANKESSANLALLTLGLKTIAELRDAARDCKACDLYKTATQTVFGEGPSKPQIMFVGEQPGDQEDQAGHPFVGPAGKLLNEALQKAGIEHSKVYLTNVVKHFKWVAATRGKKRIHKKPRYSEVHACRPWLDAELRVVKPQILVCLGSTAAQSLLGRTFSVMRQRGQLIDSPLAPFVLATVHPSSILRAPDSNGRQLQMQAFINDLKIVRKLARKAEAA